RRAACRDRDRDVGRPAAAGRVGTAGTHASRSFAARLRAVYAVRGCTSQQAAAETLLHRDDHAPRARAAAAVRALRLALPDKRAAHALVVVLAGAGRGPAAQPALPARAEGSAPARDYRCAARRPGRQRHTRSMGLTR